MKRKMSFFITKKGVARFSFFLLFSIFISPLLGIHIHHEVDLGGNKSIIHSYFFEDHDTHHPPATNPPESLPEHIAKGGVSVDMGDWDTGMIVSNVELIRMTYTLMISLLVAVIMTMLELVLIRDMFALLASYLISYRLFINSPVRLNNSYFIDLSYFYLPPPS